MVKTKLENGISFEQWCYSNLDNDKAKEILDRWDYELNKCKPSEISYSSFGFNKKGYWFKCLKHPEHKSELNNITSFTGGYISLNCKQCNSFSQWCKDNNKLDLLGRWDYELNMKSPEEVNYGSKKKYWFKCKDNKKHKSESKNINNYTNGEEGCINCFQCKSFEQWCIDNNRQDVLDRWDYELNDKLPSEISYGIRKSFYFKCPSRIHKSELKLINSISSGYKKTSECNQCNSFGQYLLDTYGENALDLYWNEKNTINPFEISKASNKKVWIICQEDISHPPYIVDCSCFSRKNGSRCPICSQSKGEQEVRQYLNDKGIIYIAQKEYNGLLGMLGKNLSYDFYIPQYNLLIEYQGEFHDGTAKIQTKKDFEKQQEHDKRKKQYATNNNINLLEIWYWDFDNIEKILDKELNKMNNSKAV